MDDRLEAMYRRFTWRILSNYVTPWEFERLRGQITDYEQWCPGGAPTRRAMSRAATRRWPPGTPSPPGMPTCAAHRLPLGELRVHP